MTDQVAAYFPDIEIHTYDTGHAFANDAKAGLYDEASAALAHQRTEAFLKKHLS